MMRESLITAASLTGQRCLPFGRIVPDFELGRIQENAQNLGVGVRRPTRQNIEAAKHEKTTQKASEQIKCRGADDRREKKETTLRSENRERLVQRPVHGVDCRRMRHGPKEIATP